jgi:hypothetical protein
MSRTGMGERVASAVRKLWVALPESWRSPSHPANPTAKIQLAYVRLPFHASEGNGQG